MNNNHISNKHLNHSEKNKIHSNTDFGKHLFSEKDISFKTFFHVSEAQNFLQAFATSTGIPSFILTQEGDVFKASGDIDKKNNNNSDVLDAFINFIHSQADSKNLPTETGIKIIENDSLYYSYSCFNILGKCVAAWYLGPVKSPQLTLEQFSNLQHFSQPSNKYEQMWGEIPVISTDKFKIIANSLDQMVQRLTQRAYLTILQEKTNNELSKSEKKFSHIFQNSPDAIAICRPKDLTILEINKGFEKLSGYSSDELIGKSLHGLLCSENECTKIFKNYEKAGELHNFELNCSLNNTDTRTLLISMTEVVFENENCVMIIYHDITERKRYLQEIEERDKLRDIISKISTQFIKLPVESIDNMIESSLGHIAKFAKTDFGFLALFDDSNDQFTLQLYKYDSKNNLIRENLNFSPQNSPWFMDQIFNKNNIKFNSVEDISSLPDKKYLSKLNIGAMSGIALLDQKKILGVAGFISKEKNHNWSNNDELLLQLACQIFSNALAKKTNSQKLQDSEKKYHSILQHLAEIVCVIDLDLNILFVSPSCENILGYSENDLIGKNFTELVNREKRNSIIKEIKKTSNGANSSSPVVFSLQHKKGHWIEVETLCDDKLNEPEINGIILTMRDITTQKQSEEKYKKSEEKFQQHFANVQDVIYTFNRKLQITSVSPSVEKILDYKPKELIGKPFTKMDLLSKQSLFKALTDLRAIFSGQGDVLSEIHFKAKDGSIKIGEVKASPVIEDGTITGIIGVARDITDRKKIENELFESEKRYRALVENAIVPIVVVTKNVISYLNHAAVELLGTKNTEQAVNQKFEKFIHPDYEKLFTAKFDKSFQLNKKPKNLLLKIIKPDKKIIDVQINAIAVTINNIKSQLLILNDITLQKQAEELLLTQHEFMAGLTRIHGLNDTLDYCLNQSIIIGQMDIGAIYLYDKMSNKMSLERSINCTEQFLSTIKSYDNNIAYVEMLQRGNSLYLNNKELKRTSLKSLMELSTAAVFPIFYHNQFIASIHVGSYTKQEIPKETREILEITASQLGNIISRAQAEDELRQSERRYRTMVDSLPEAVCRWLPDTTLTFVNDAYCEMFGVKAQDIIGQKWLQFIPDNEKKSLTKIYKKLTQNPALNKYEHQIIDSRGNTRWHSWIDSPILDKNGQLLEFQSVGRDITERIQNEKTLQHRLEIEAVLSKTSTRFVGVFNIDKAISQSLRDMTTFIQADRGYLFQFQHDKKYMDNTHEWCNKGVEPQIQNLQNIPCNLFPWWMTKLENNEIIDVKDVSKLPKEANEEKKILQTQEIKSLIVFPVYSGKRLSGYIGFDNINRSYALQGFDHKLLKMFSQVIGNALLQQQSETALRYSENRFRSMADNTQDGVIIFENNKIVYLNNRISEIWGLASDTIGKFSISEFLSPQDRKLVQEKKNSDLSELLPKKSEFWITHKNGTKRYIQNKYTIIPNNRGGYFYYLFCTDLTERKNAEEALKQSENQYHTLFEAAEDAIFLLRGSKPFDCNQAALKLFEGDKKDILNIPVYELSPAFQQNKKNSETLAKEIIQNVLNGHPQHFEWQHLTFSGKTVDTEVSLKRIELAGEMVLQAVIRDISTRKQIENERLRHLHFLESMEDIEKAISKTSDMDTIFDNILKTVTKIFACECAFLINPCLPSINTSNIEFIYTTDNIEKDIDKLITVDQKVANTFKLSLERHELIDQTTKTELAQFIGTKPVKAQLMMSLHPKTDKPWLFVIQHYKKEHEWVNEEKQLFIEISRRISDVLSNLITLKNLRESEEKFRALAENSLDTIMRFDSKGRHLYVNPIVEYQTGISWEKFIGKTHTEMGFPSHLVHLWDNSIRNVFLRRKPHRIEFQLPNNTWIDWQLIPEFSEDGDVKAVITSARDITEMKKTEKALIENEEKYRYLVERAYDSIVIVQNNKIKFVNAAFCRMFGYQKEEIIDKPYEILVAPESFKILKSHYNDRISNQSPPMIYEIKVKHKNGKIFDAELNAGKVLYYGKPSSFVFIRDITERKKAHEAQRLAERAQRFGSLVTLTAGVSHEINQPLTALKVKVDGLIYWGEKDPQTLQKNILKNLEFISEQAGKIDQIIKHMRSLTRQEKMVPTAVDLNEIIKRASTLVSQRLKSHNVNLILKLETELKPVLGSDTPLEQVVINLITNSLHALDTVSMPKKQIIIQTHSDTEQCTMEVIDNGPGIDEERLEQIFDPFFTTKIQEEGMGLGLAIVQNILTNLDGKIKVSNNKNGGARFTVILPIENKGNIR